MITDVLLQSVTANVALVLGVVSTLTTAAALFVNAVINVIRLAVALRSWQTLAVNAVISAVIVAALMAALGIEPSFEMGGVYVLVVASVFGAAAGVYQLNKAAIREGERRKGARVYGAGKE